MGWTRFARRPFGHDERMLMMPHRDARDPVRDWPLAMKSILGFWLFYAVTVVSGHSSAPTRDDRRKQADRHRRRHRSDRADLSGDRAFDPTAPIRRKAGVAIITRHRLGPDGDRADVDRRPCGARAEEIRFQAREGVTVVEKGRQVRIERPRGEPLVLTLPKVAQLDGNKRFRYAADAAVIWLFFFLAWSAFYLAMQAQSVALGAQRRAAEAEGAAQAAQVRALRYQVNPHFLFNTLNSLSSLIIAGRARRAESMVLKLSNFFRQSLTLEAGRTSASPKRSLCSGSISTLRGCVSRAG